MSEQSIEAQFTAVQFFTMTSSSHLELADDSYGCSFQRKGSQRQTNMQSQESTNHQIFIESFPHEEIGHNDVSLKTKSRLHNLQKHLFTFLQSLIWQKDLNFDIQGGNDQISDCVREIMLLIKGQKRKTKEQLVIVFGEFNLGKIRSNSQGYKNLTNRYSIDTLKLSFEYVKQELISRIGPQLLRKYLQKSKMERKGEFMKYLQIFVEEVRERSFSSKLSKKSQNCIKEKMKEELKLEDWADVIV